MKKNHFPFYFLAALLVMTINIQSQVCISDATASARLKKSITYFVVSDKNTEEIEPYIKAVKDVWTVSEIEVIDSDEMASHIKDDVFFLYVGKREKIETEKNTVGNVTISTPVARKIPCITLWYVSDLKKSKKKGVEYKVNEVAFVDLYADFYKCDINNYTFSSTTENRFFNLRPGFFRNYLQCLNTLLSKNKMFDNEKDNSKRSELIKLKTDTLFVPKFVLQGINVKVRLSGTTLTKVKYPADEIFADYTFTYKMISNEKLSTKILEDNTLFYYLIFVQAWTNRYVSVINSKTGEIIYCRVSHFKWGGSSAYSLNAKDVGKLAKTISTGN